MLAQKAIVIYAKTAAAAYSGDAAHIPFRCVPPFGLDFQQRLKLQSNVWEGKNKTWSETTEMQESGKERGRWRRALAIVKLPPAVTCEGGSERAGGRARNPREAKKKPRQSVSKVRRGGNVSSKVTAKQTAAVKQLKTLIRSRMWRLHPAEGLPDSRRLVEFSAKKKKKKVIWKFSCRHNKLLGFPLV